MHHDIKLERLSYSEVEGVKELFTSSFCEYLIDLHDKFDKTVAEIRSNRAKVLDKALRRIEMPSYLPVSEINTSDWKVPPLPEDLKKPGIEISGPACVTGMFINALNPGPNGHRAEGYLDDDEDSAGHRFIDTVTAAINRLSAVRGSLEYYDKARDKQYKLQNGPIPFFMHRERGLHLDEPEVRIDGSPVSAALLGTGLTMFHAGREQINNNQGIYFYLPKLESADEAGFWRNFFDFSKTYLNFPSNTIIRAIPLVESLPITYQMEEALYALGPYAAGLNAARWDLKASIFEFVLTDPNSVWPDRFDVDVKTTDFIADIFRRLIAICVKRGAVPIGGMATALPSKDPEVNKAASESIRADKKWEAEQGFIRAWVAHIFHMDAAAAPFKEIHKSRTSQPAKKFDTNKYPIKIAVPNGSITVDGTRRNARMLIEYIEGWIEGRGAKGIDSLEGRPGIHPALMEDLATGRMSTAQIAQRILHKAKDDNTGEVHDFGLVKKILIQEKADILNRIRTSSEQNEIEFTNTEARYGKATKIAMHWIKNYCELNFRSLGSYTRDELESIANENDPF